MKWKFTYKEFSLLLGILVAVIIMITLWMKPFSLESGKVSEKPTPLVKPTATIPLGKTYVVVPGL